MNKFNLTYFTISSALGLVLYVLFFGNSGYLVKKQLTAELLVLQTDITLLKQENKQLDELFQKRMVSPSGTVSPIRSQLYDQAAGQTTEPRDNFSEIRALFFVVFIGICLIFYYVIKTALKSGLILSE